MHLTPHYGYENIAQRRGQENYSVHIFSAKEMAFNILGTMHPLSSLVQLQSGMDRLMDLADIMAGQKSEWDCITILLK
jgi:3-oxoacyl-ACP reductase-like protein